MKLRYATCFLLAAAVLAGFQQSGEAEKELEAAIHKEVVQGDLKAAIEQYKKLAQGANKPVAARALVSSAHAGHSYALTGPQSLNQRDKVRLIGEVIGKELSFEEISPEQVRQAMKAQGVPPDVPDRMLGYLAECIRNPGPSTANVELVLSRPALTFAEWAADHAAAFRN